MRLHNFIPQLLECLSRWNRRPSLKEFGERYHAPMAEFVTDAFGDAADMHGLLSDLNWANYRRAALQLDPLREQERVLGHVRAVERVFGFPLKGEIVLLGAFGALDGYARFDRGSHRVFLGVDEGAAEGYEGGALRGDYLDILEVHELTHVARESRPQVWTDWGLDPRMTHDEFVEKQPVLEHLFGEGFSCAVSELLVPSMEPWNYSYQENREVHERILAHGGTVDRAVHRELRAGSDADWGRLYSSRSYTPRLPVFTHYVWAWQWVRNLLTRHAGGDPAKLVTRCSREFAEDALAFRLGK